MEFKVGQVWRNGDGALHTIEEVFHDSLSYYPVVAVANNVGDRRTYTLHGRYVGDNTPCEFDLVELVRDVDEPEQESDESAPVQAESSGKMLDEGGDRALFDALAVQSVVTGMIERKGVEWTLDTIRLTIDVRRAL